MVTGSALARVDPVCAAAVERTAALLAEHGHRVEEARLPARDRLEVGPWIAAGIARELNL